MKNLITIIIFSQIFLGDAITTCWSDSFTINQNIKPGQTAEYSLEISNNSNKEQSFKLSSDGLPKLMNISFTANGPALKSITIPANDRTQLTAAVEVPINTKPGKFTGRFTAVDSKGSSSSIPFSMNVTNIHSLKIISWTTTVQAFSGQDFNFEVEILNSGISNESNITIIVDAPAKWIVQLPRIKIKNLLPGEKNKMSVKILIPSSQVAVDQIIKFHIKSDFTESTKRELTVHVQKNPVFFIPLGIIALLTIIIVFVYFKIKGRR